MLSKKEKNMFKKERIVLVLLFSIVVIYLSVHYGIKFLGINGDNHPLIGKKAPELTIKGIDGTSEVKLSSFSGKKAIILDFWASWCGPCRQALPIMENLAKQYNPEQFSVIAVNVWDGNIDQIKRFLSEKNIKTVNVFIETDKETNEKFMFSGVPAIFILDGDLNIKQFYRGYSPSLERAIKKTVEKLISEKNQ